MPLVTVPVVAIERKTPRSSLLSIDVAGTGFSFVAGQAVMVGVHGLDDRRPYSVACSPEHLRETGRIDLLIALDPGAVTATHLSRAEPGTLLDVEGPMGAFTFPAETGAHRILFVAGGTGIAPLRSMLGASLGQDPTRSVSLLYSARHSDEFAFIDELLEHARAGRIELHQTVTRDEDSTWGGSRGRVGPRHFEAVLHEPGKTLCFVCGPPLFVREAVASLEALGVPEGLIRTEQWDR